MFWKENGKLIRRLWLNLFGGVTFGFLLSALSTNLAARFPGHAAAIYIISGVIGAFFYLYLLYLVIWEAGASDRIRADGGRITGRPWHGIKIALVFSSPALAVTLIYLLMSVLFAAFRVDNSFVRGTLDVSGTASLIFGMPHVGFALAIFGAIGKSNIAESRLIVYSVFMFLVTLPAIATLTFGYYFGYQGKFMSHTYKRKKQ